MCVCGVCLILWFLPSRFSGAFSRVNFPVLLLDRRCESAFSFKGRPLSSNILGLKDYQTRFVSNKPRIFICLKIINCVQPNPPNKTPRMIIINLNTNLHNLYIYLVFTFGPGSDKVYIVVIIDRAWIRLPPPNGCCSVCMCMTSTYHT